MRNAILCGILLMACGCGGCAGSALLVTRMDAQKLSTVSDDKLIRALRWALSNEMSRTEAMFQEGKKRSWFTDDDILLIRKGKIEIGMTERALLASWGYPINIRKPVSADGENKQYVYVYGKRYLFSSRSYVYVDNGTITSWQD
jgi:hypothetical protein